MIKGETVEDWKILSSLTQTVLEIITETPEFILQAEKILPPHAII